MKGSPAPPKVTYTPRHREDALVFQNGRRVLIKRGGLLRSDICFKCADAAEKQKTFQLNWQSKRSMVIGLICPLPLPSETYSTAVTVGFCDQHWNGLIAWNLLAVFGFLGLLVGGLCVFAAGHLIGLLAMLLSFLPPLLAFVFGRQVTVSTFKGDTVEICGAGRAFLKTLPPLPRSASR